MLKQSDLQPALSTKSNSHQPVNLKSRNRILSTIPYLYIEDPDNSSYICFIKIHYNVSKTLFLWLMLVSVTGYGDTTSVKWKVTATCPVIQNLPDTLVTCDSFIQLNPALGNTGGVELIDTIWTPSTGLSDANIIDPIVTVNGAQLYKLTIHALKDSNLVVNGDFSAGNSGFSSGYILGTGGSFGLLSNPGEYVVANNPSSTHNLFASFGDHTSGNGMMLVVNGASIPNVNIWCQTIPVQQNTLYDFSAWVASATANNPAILQFSINGTLLNTPFSVPATLSLWTQFHASWYSGNATTATICIANQNTASDGNDFALDDIAFKELCIVSDSVYIKDGAIKAIFSAPDTVCNGATINFSGSSAGSSTTHYWDFGDSSTSNSITTTHTFLNPGLYTVTYAVSSGMCSDTTHHNIFVKSSAHYIRTAEICPGDSIFFGLNYISDTGTFHHNFNSAGGCDSNVTLTVKFKELPVADFTYVSELNQPVKFTNTSINASKYFWAFGDATSSTEVHPEHSYKETGTYQVCLTAWSLSGCMDITCKKVYVEVVYVADVPTAFSPNNDGKNDVLFVKGNGIVKMLFRIYNRWGQMIFESKELTHGWDGTYKGQPVDMETIAYTLQVTFGNGETLNKQGNITVIR